MQIRFAQLFLSISVCAVFLAMRYWWVTSEDNRIAIATPIVVSMFCGALLGALRRNAFTVLAMSGFVGFLAAVAYTLESLCHSAATEFLRHPHQHEYADDPALNTIAVVAFTLISAAAGGVAGLAASLLRSIRMLRR